MKVEGGNTGVAKLNQAHRGRRIGWKNYRGEGNQNYEHMEKPY